MVKKKKVTKSSEYNILLEENDDVLLIEKNIAKDLKVEEFDVT